METRSQRIPTRRPPIILLLLVISLASFSCDSAPSLALAPSPTSEIRFLSVQATVTPSATPVASPTRQAEPTATLAPTHTVIAMATATRPPQTPTARPSLTPTRSATQTPKPAPPTSTPGQPAPAVTTTNWAPNSDNLIVHAKADSSYVALTFDAGGKDPGGTAALLDALKKYGFKATFFLTGEWSEANPALVRRMQAEGHELANHTWDHPNLPDISNEKIVSQLTRTEKAIEAISGSPIKKYVRPPFGAYDKRVLGAAGSLGYEVVYWTIDAGDWREELTAEDVVARNAKAKAGDVIVAHCYAPKTAQSIDRSLAGFAARGLKGGTLSQALGRN